MGAKKPASTHTRTPGTHPWAFLYRQSTIHPLPLPPTDRNPTASKRARHLPVLPCQSVLHRRLCPLGHPLFSLCSGAHLHDCPLFLFFFCRPRSRWCIAACSLFNGQIRSARAAQALESGKSTQARKFRFGFPGFNQQPSETIGVTSSSPTVVRASREANYTA